MYMQQRRACPCVHAAEEGVSMCTCSRERACPCVHAAERADSLPSAVLRVVLARAATVSTAPFTFRSASTRTR